MSTGSKGRACDGKKKHGNRAAAMGQIGRLVRQRGANPARYEAYECRHCGAWHVGHTSRGKR